MPASVIAENWKLPFVRLAEKCLEGCRRSIAWMHVICVHKSLIEKRLQSSAQFPTMKESFVVLLVCFHAGFGSLERRIYNGRNARGGEFPFIANVEAAGITCGGALISQSFVLTAAHCLRNLDEHEKFTITLGTVDFYPFDEDGDALKFRTNMKFWMHENFSLPSAENDIAVVRLPRLVKFSEKIQPIKISRNGRVDQRTGDVLTVVMGWGERASGGPADFLQTARMKLIPIRDCLRYQSHFVETITMRHICAMGADNEEAYALTPCDGDSGEHHHSNVTKSEADRLIVRRHASGSSRDERTNWHNELRQGC